MTPGKMPPLVKRCGSVFYRYKTTSAKKIHWNYEENKVVGSVSQQLNQLGLDASTSADAHGFIEQQHYQFTGYKDEAVDEHDLTARQHYEIMCGEEAL